MLLFYSRHRFPIYLVSTKYAQKIRKLRCKIFNEFYIPELSKKELEYGTYHLPVCQWSSSWKSELRVVERHEDAPRDQLRDKNEHYYPAHPQIRHATHVLREYGLYRDEHRDFNEAMKLVAIARGKVFRERRGPNTDKPKKSK